MEMNIKGTVEEFAEMERLGAPALLQGLVRALARQPEGVAQERVRAPADDEKVLFHLSRNQLRTLYDVYTRCKNCKTPDEHLEKCLKG